VRRRAPPPAAELRHAWCEYAALRDALGVRPRLERLLAGRLPGGGDGDGGGGGGGGV
jgi:hypothetical protein